MIQALVVLLPVAYVAAAVAYALFFGGPEAPSGVGARRVATAVAIAMHVALFVARGVETGNFPVGDPWANLSAAALGLCLIHLAASWRLSRPGAGSVVLGLVATLQIAASAFGPITPAGVPFEPAALFHGLVSIAAASALLSSGIHGGLYLLLLRRMRARRLGPLERRLPSLDALALLTRRSALGGFLLLGVGVNAGIAWAHQAQVEGFRYTDPLVLVMLVLWVHFGLVAFSRRIPGLTARRASYAAAGGLTLFLAASILVLVPDLSFHGGVG